MKLMTTLPKASTFHLLARHFFACFLPLLFATFESRVRKTSGKNVWKLFTLTKGRRCCWRLQRYFHFYVFSVRSVLWFEGGRMFNEKTLRKNMMIKDKHENHTRRKLKINEKGEISRKFCSACQAMENLGNSMFFLQYNFHSFQTLLQSDLESPRNWRPKPGISPEKRVVLKMFMHVGKFLNKRWLWFSFPEKRFSLNLKTKINQPQKKAFKVFPSRRWRIFPSVFCVKFNLNDDDCEFFSSRSRTQHCKNFPSTTFGEGKRSLNLRWEIFPCAFQPFLVVLLILFSLVFVLLLKAIKHDSKATIPSCFLFFSFY